jgi:hypothetical protein
MIGRVHLWIGCGVLLLGCVGASSASAQNGILLGQGGGYGIGSFNYGGGINQQSIPYYALYPPVYYSHPVPRAYGYSPFAYPPGVMTPDVAPPVGAMYMNPYVPQPADSKPVDRTAAKTYYNPFVQQASAGR